MTETTNKKPQYKNLNHKERELLFAFYEKWNGNMLAMVRDGRCPLKSRNQIAYYKNLYNFEEQFLQNRANWCKEIMDSLKDSKIEAIQRAIELIKPRQRMLKVPITGEPLLDKDNQPIFIEDPPSYKEIQAAWEIIKTELGEPTQISKGDITSGGKPINSNVITFGNFKADEK